MSKNYLHQLQDKSSYIHIFAGLINNPYLLAEHPMSEKDFPERFHKIVFSAIYNLYQDGAEGISSITIDGYLKSMPTQHRIFEEGQGIDYIEACLERGEARNFSYHYNRVKKFTLLRQYYSSGIDISDIYSVEFMNLEQEVEQHRKFNDMTVQQMIRHVEAKLIDIKDEFVYEKDGYGGHISDNIDEILTKAMERPDYGAPFLSGYYNTTTRGARRRKFYCTSGNPGSGKTRKGLGDLLFQCVPFYYDLDKQMWVYTGNREKGLFISTELEEDEVKIPALCFIANVDEDSVRNNELTDDERQRLRIAVKVLEKTDFWIEELFDFDVDDLEHLIQKYVNKHDVGYVFFDYLQTTLKMFDSMAKRGAKNLQEHQILRILSTQLKNMCNKYNIWLGTATQLNTKWKEEGNMDETAIEGSKSVANKFDLGAIQVGTTVKDDALWEEIKGSINVPFGLEPTHTINVYKNRGVKWKFIRIWIHFNMGTLRVTDLFVTNYKGKVVDMRAKHFTSILDNVDCDMNEEQLLAFLEELTEDGDNEEYKNTEFDHAVDNEIKEELKEIEKELLIVDEEYDELTDVFNEEVEEDKTKSFGESKGSVASSISEFNW